MDTDSFDIHIKTEDFYEDIADDRDKWFDTSNYDNNRLLPIGKNKKVISLFKDESGGKIMIEFVRLKYIHTQWIIIVNIKKLKEQKNCVIKRTLMFENCTDCLFNDKILLKSQQRFKSDYHNVCTEQINKIAQYIHYDNDDKRLQRFDKIT